MVVPNSFPNSRKVLTNFIRQFGWERPSPTRVVYPLVTPRFRLTRWTNAGTHTRVPATGLDDVTYGYVTVIQVEHGALRASSRTAFSP